TVKTNDSTITNNGTENCGPESGTVDTNNGEIKNNYGTVETNAEGGSIGANYGKVDTNEAGAKVVLNDGTIGENRGDVTSNGSPSVDGSEEGNGEQAVVHNNSGTVLSNNDIVDNINGGVVTSNFGLVNNAAGGVVIGNAGPGTVNNEADGKVEENTGIVNNKAGGLLNDVFLTKNPESTGYDDYYIKQFEQFTGEAATYVGTELEVGWIETTNEETGEKTYRGFEDDGICNIVKQAIQGTVLNLKELGKLFQKADYEVVGYQEYNRASDGAESSADKPVVYQTMYKVQYPDIWLNLIWGKAVIKPVASPAGDEAVPTSYNPNYIGLGSVIFINEKGYKVVEIKDDAYVVVTFDALPDEDVADLNALYAKLFTPEQQKLVKNMGQLLDSEDVLTIFGKPGNHPVFEFQKDLVK
ncbi:MAG: hypothetical protein Q4F81_10900, partial [Eubacteriales bacterium]|nr:hypothetical protein [Eubacteriales bacterium]